MNRVKVAHLTTVDASLRFLLLGQMQALRDAGYDVVGISASGPHVAVLESEGIRHLSAPLTRNITPFADLVCLHSLYRLMRRERFTIVHTHTPKAGLLGQLAARMAGVPIVVNTLHGFYFHEHMHPLKRRFFLSLEKVAARCSDLILSQNREDMGIAIRERICPPEKIVELGNGIDLSVFDPSRITPDDVRQQRRELGIQEGTKVIGFVGRLAARRKGFLDFLRAGKEVARRLGNVCFLIVGEADRGKSDAVDPEQLRQHPLWPCCRFLGARPNAEMPLLYATMDLLVLPSLFEGIPRVVMEASAMGIPSVVTDVKGNREAVEAGRSGLLVPWNDSVALADAIVAVLSDLNKARALGTEARRLALERFDERRVFAKVLDAYDRLLQGELVVRNPSRPREIRFLPVAGTPRASITPG